MQAPTVPAWVRWTLSAVDALAGCDLVAIVVSERDQDVRPSRPSAYDAYERLDSTIFGAASALRPTDLSDLAAGRTEMPDDDSVDVAIAFVPPDRVRTVGSPRHGIWALDPMDDGATGGAMRFWELRSRAGTTTTALVTLGDGGRRVIAAQTARADPLSLTRTRNIAAWEGARLVVRNLRSLVRDGAVPASGGRSRAAGPPDAKTVAAHATRTFVRGSVAKARTALFRDEWFVAVRALDGGGPAASFQPLPNPPGRYLGDPFVVEVEGRHFLFVEDYSLADRKAVISVCEGAPGGGWAAPRTVLEADHHLSYPFVFEHEGSIYMIPETHSAGRIELHRAVAFPHTWRLERVLVAGITAVDATLHFAPGRLWMFASVLDGPEDRGELHLFSAASLDGAWAPHPRNPIVSDPGRARPAGRLFRRDGSLIRPAQDGARDYGAAIVLNRVDVLARQEYRETPVGRIEPSWLPNLRGTHTYTYDSGFECLDGRRYVRRLPRLAERPFFA